jgi:hypothetical protein
MIEEFKALRDEVIRCESESLKITLYVFTGALVAASLAEKSWLPKLIIPVLFQIILLWGMQRYHSLSSTRLKLSTYIQVMLEPVLEGINWEHRNHRFNQLNPRRYYFFNKFIRRPFQHFGHLFFLLTSLGFYLSIQALLETVIRPLLFWLFVGLLFFLHTMSTFLMVKCVFLRPNESTYIGYWEKIKAEEKEGTGKE